MAISSRNKVNVSFSLSGMTDIVFLLLLFFMLVSTLTAPVAMNVQLPESTNQTAANPLITISITNKFEYMVDDQLCGFDQVEGLAKKMDIGLAGGANNQKISTVIFEDFKLEVENK